MTYATMVFADVSSDLYLFSVNLWLQNGLYAQKHSEKLELCQPWRRKPYTIHSNLLIIPFSFCNTLRKLPCSS